ncbi:MAG: HD-GYP domain-containing protein [Candidatus Anammoxibacter sp.]
MLKTIKTTDLKVGMFISLAEENWMSNPFWKTKLLLTSEKDIKKILKSGIANVDVDTDKSKVQVSDIQERKNVAVKKTENIVIPAEPNKEGQKKEEPEKECQKEEGPKIGKDVQQEDVPIENVKVVDNKEEPEKHDEENSSPTSDWNPKAFMPDEIVDAFKDESLPPEERANVVTKYSMELMKNLLDSPTTEVISASKKGISEIVDVVLHEEDTANSLVKIVSHDFYTYTHSVSVGIKSILLAKKLYKDASKEKMDALGAGFFLHDLGKVNVNPDIINKPSRLTEEEMAEMRTHPYQAYKILSETKHLTEEAWVIAMQHHERDDGNGYPRKIKGKDIHPYARICCLADVYDALTAKRPYKEKKTPVVALKIMYEEMATHFNIELLENFISLFKGGK